MSDKVRTENLMGNIVGWEYASFSKLFLGIEIIWAYLKQPTEMMIHVLLEKKMIKE